MVSIKHQAFNILNKYIEINGIRKISPNDMSKYIYALEDPANKNNKLNDKSYSFFSKQMQNYSVKNQNIQNMEKTTNKSPIRKYITPNLTPINRNINNNNINDKNINDKDNNNSININKNKEKVTDFSNLLALVTNAKQMRNEDKFINKTINNNKFKSAKNININNNNDLNLNLNTMQKKESSRSLSKNIFNEKLKVNSSIEEGKTMIMAKDTEVLLPSTLNNIFNENKADEIKEQIYKSKKKEIFRKVLSFGKKAAELLTNEKYTVFFVDKKDELAELENKSIIISKSLIKDNVIFKKK